MIEVRQTEAFQFWLRDLKDSRAKQKIATRLRQTAFGNFGDSKSVGEGVQEMRIHYGPGYRMYYVRRGEKIIVLLCGGTKRKQDKDIELAKSLAKEL